MKLPILPALAVVAVALATACGGSSSSDNASNTGTRASSSRSGGYADGTTPQNSPATSSGAVSLKTGSGELGKFLVDSQGRTLYLWEADKGSSSTCSGACAQAWPPLITKDAPKAGDGVKASLLGTTRRDDGTLEVTYDGHPLYYYAGDSSLGQTSGQGSDGFGADWWVVAPSGKAITKGDQG